MSGLGKHDDESRFSLLNVKHTENNDSIPIFSVIDDHSLLGSGALRKGI